MIAPPTSVPVATAIALERLMGLSFTVADAAICTTMSVTCNAALQRLYANPLTKPVIGGFAAPCLSSGATPAVQVTNATITIYGAYTTVDCNALVGAFAASASLPGVGLDVLAAVSGLGMCTTDDCNRPAAAAAASGAAPLRAGAAAAAAVLAAAAAALAA